MKPLPRCLVFRWTAGLVVWFGIVLAAAGQAETPPQKPLSLEERKALADKANALRPKTVQLFNDGKYAEAARINLEILALYRQALPADQYPDGHPAIAAGLGFQAAMLKMQKKNREAVSYVEQALAMYDKLFPPKENPNGRAETDRTLDMLGLLLYDLGGEAFARQDLRQAIADFGRAVPVYERRYAPARYPRGDLNLARAYNGLGGAYLHAGEHHRAIPYFRKAFTLYEQLNPKANSDLARSLNNMGSLLREQGEYAEARKYLERANAMFAELYPKGHPDRALHLNNLGILYHHLKQDKLARETLDQALKMSRDAYPDGHANLVGCLLSVASVASEQGDTDRAIRLGEEALEMCQRLYPEKDYPQGRPELAGALHNLSTYLAEAGRYDKAEDRLRRCLTMNERLYDRKLYPLGHPNLALVLHSLGEVLWQSGKTKEARQQLEHALTMYQDWADANYAGVSEAEALRMAPRLTSCRDALLSATCPPVSAPSVERDASYAFAWRGKAAITQAMERRQQVLVRIADPEVHKLWQDLIDTRRQLSRLALSAPGPAEAHREQLRRVIDHKEELERRIAGVPQLARELGRGRRAHTDLLKELPAGVVFIDFLRYGRYRQDSRKPGREGTSQTASYVAFVLRPGGPVVRIELGEAAAIDAAVQGWREEIKGRRRGERAAELYRRVWEPLASHFGGARVILLSPDGALTAVPWGALPGRAKDTLLIEENALALVPHGPFLLEHLTTASPGEEDKGLLLAAGDVRYDAEPAPLPHPPAIAVYRTADAGSKHWPPLKGTSQELDAVKELAGERPIRSLRGAEASTARLLTELSGARWAHLATHGFFANPKVKRPLPGGPLRYSPDGVADGPVERSPLLLSGLVWAGANRPRRLDRSGAPEGDGGILTAEAIASLPLHEMELVVLSACETGLGEVSEGEGVFGLQRAFHQAGARHVIASLWKVDDQATVALMLLFYRKLWKENLPPQSALRAAQLELYRHPKRIHELTADRGVDFIDIAPQDTAHPRLWAAFLVSGVSRSDLVRLVKEMNRRPGK